MTLAESLKLAPNASVCILNQTALASVIILVLGSLHVDPHLDLDGAGAVVELVGNICGLLADVTDLANERDGGQFGAVNGEILTVGLIGFEQLLYGNGT